MIGIYKIETKHNSKVYIGSSDNVERRIKTHFSRLKRNVHHSAYLQSTYNKYGKENLIVSVIEVLEDNSQKVVREQYWMDYYKSYDKKYGYNMSKIANSNTTGEVPIYQYDLDGSYIRDWSSTRKASTHYKVSDACIYNSLVNRKRTSIGYQWSYIKKDKLNNLLKFYCAYDLDGSFVRKFLNAKEAARFVGTERNANIIRACKTNGRYKDYYWRLENSYIIPKTISI